MYPCGSINIIFKIMHRDNYQNCIIPKINTSLPEFYTNVSHEYDLHTTISQCDPVVIDYYLGFGGKTSLAHIDTSLSLESSLLMDQKVLQRNSISENFKRFRSFEGTKHDIGLHTQIIFLLPSHCHL